MSLPALKFNAENESQNASFVISEVKSSKDLDAFVLFPQDLYKADPNWVSPLLMERREFLNKAKNPWFEFGQAQLFLARRNGQVVGRIAAVCDPRYNEFHQVKLGAFGMFECIHDTSVAKALFEAAATWCRQKGFSSMWGPLNFSTNNECAVLVEGYDSSPSVMMTYNPPYYVELYEACGFQKAKDLWAWELSTHISPPEKAARVADKIREREGVVIRSVQMNDFDNEVKRIKDIYNSAWEKNWGFVPMTDKEFDYLAATLRQIVVPELLLIAEVAGEPVAFSMAVPDANVALKAAKGRLTTWGLPIGLVRLLWASRKIKWLRLITLGVKAGFRRRGIDAILYLESIRRGKELGYDGGEISWTLEDNHLINRAIESLGARRTKTYRLYQKAI